RSSERDAPRLHQRASCRTLPASRTGDADAMAMNSALPMIGIPCCVKPIKERPFHAVGEKYIDAVAREAGGLPLLVPGLDGLFLTGSPSNVEPHHYGGAPSRPGTAHDPQRDATTLPLIRAAVAAGLPVLAVCRGIQELNAALGGTLHQLVHELPGRRDHRSPQGTIDEKYAHTAHP